MQTTVKPPPIRAYHPDTGELAVPKCTIALGGGYFALKAPSHCFDPKNRNSTRREIQEYSRASRRRLMRILNCINRDKLICMPLFITLTYPGEYPEDPPTWKRHLANFIKRIRRHYNEVAIIWRLEPQQRLAPHFHLLVFQLPFIPHLEVSRTWYEVVGSGDTKHLSAGCRTERIISWHGVTYYAAKYIGKVGDARFDRPVGRYWGIAGREHLPVDLLVLSVDWETWYQLRRVYWKWAADHNVPIGRKTRFNGIQSLVDNQTSSKMMELIHVVLGSDVEHKF